jgi:hypothetical protein
MNRPNNSGILHLWTANVQLKSQRRAEKSKCTPTPQQNSQHSAAAQIEQASAYRQVIALSKI